MTKFILLFVLSLTSIIYANDIALIEAVRNGNLKEVQALIKNTSVTSSPTPGTDVQGHRRVRRRGASHRDAERRQMLIIKLIILLESLELL